MISDVWEISAHFVAACVRLTFVNCFQLMNKIQTTLQFNCTTIRMVAKCGHHSDQNSARVDQEVHVMTNYTLHFPEK